MTVPVEDFVQQLINEANSRRSASSKSRRARKQPLFLNCEVIVDNAIMPSCSLREKTRCSSNHTEGRSSRATYNDLPIVPFPSRFSTTESSSSSSRTSRRSREKRNDHGDTISSPRIITSPWNTYSSLECFVDRSPHSVLIPPPRSANIFPPISPRSARWTSSSTPPRTFLKTKSGLKRLESDHPLACPQRLLVSPGGETSSS